MNSRRDRPAFFEDEGEPSWDSLFLEAHIRPFELHVRDLVELNAKFEIEHDAERQVPGLYPRVVDVGIEGRFPNTFLILTLQSGVKEYRNMQRIWADRDGLRIDTSSKQAVKDLMSDARQHAGNCLSRAIIGAA